MSQAVATDRKLFLNLAVEDLNKSKAFFSALGFTFNPKFTDENAACMVVNDDAFVMLLTRRSSRTSQRGRFAIRDLLQKVCTRLPATAAPRWTRW